MGAFLLCAEKLYLFACEWNYRADHCMYGSTCKLAEHHGASILHGSRESFHNDKQPAFKAVYDAIKDVSHFMLHSSLSIIMLVPFSFSVIY